MRYKVFAILACIGLVFFMGLVVVQQNRMTQEAQAEPEPAVPVAHAEGEFSTHLPIVLLDTLGEEFEEKEDIWTQISVIDNENGINFISDTPDIQVAALTHQRGATSFHFDKKQYRLEFYEEMGSDKQLDISVMGMASESDWVLNAPYLDKTLVRNALMYQIARDTMEWAPDTRFCELFLNGEYMGLYLMMETVKVSENRLDLSDFGLLSGDTSYLVLRDRWNSRINQMETYGIDAAKTSYPWFIQYPVYKNLTDAQATWIERDISEFERVLYGENFDDPEAGYQNYIDMDSFVTYFVINEFSLNEDAGFLSTYCYRDIAGKLKMGPVWDFNNTFDNFQGYEFPADEFCLPNNDWFERLVQDKAFVDAVVAKYRELRQGILSEEELYARIDGYHAYLGEAIDRNFEVWGSSFERTLLTNREDGTDRNPKSFEEAVEQLKNCIHERGAFLDANIEKLYFYCVN